MNLHDKWPFLAKGRQQRRRLRRHPPWCRYSTLHLDPTLGFPDVNPLTIPPYPAVLNEGRIRNLAAIVDPIYVAWSEPAFRAFGRNTPLFKS